MDYKYQGRVYRDKSLKENILKDLKILVYAMLGDKQLDVQNSKEYTDFGVVGWKQEHKWFAYVKPGGYMFGAKSEIGLYTEIIKRIAGDELYFPL
jgi:hypothetical protein